MVLSDATMAELTGIMGRLASDGPTKSCGVVVGIQFDACGAALIALRERALYGMTRVADPGKWFPLGTVEFEPEEAQDGE